MYELPEYDYDKSIEETRAETEQRDPYWWEK